VVFVRCRRRDGNGWRSASRLCEYRLEHPRDAVDGPTSQAIDLNPASTTTSWLYAVRNGRQVGCTLGWGATGNQYYAGLWKGTVASYVDLSAFLPGGFTSSCAYGVDAYGNVAGYGTDSAGTRHAIFWKRG
ncbi:MAG: hypothetical protein M3N13_02190, partial [Candidatus Eremiobacteraeota bacterium]|nr:hypothetical protein [Candidatus Eremiobacteraeota bacterium]